MLKDSFVGFQMALGSALTALFLISGCTTSGSSYYADINSAPSASSGQTSVSGSLAKMIRRSAYSVPKQDRDKHELCVYFALDNLYIGEKCDWFSENGSTKGEVSVNSYQPSGSGYCATLFSAVYHNGNWVNWQDVACTQGTGNQWRFVSY